MTRTPPRPPQAVVFDCDGLLLNTEEVWTRAEGVLFAEHGLAFTPDHKRALLGTSRAVAGALLEDFLDRPGEADALMDQLHDLVMRETVSGPVEQMPGAEALVVAVRDAGLPVAVATNSPRDFATAVLTASGLLGRLDAVVTASDVRRGKPDPDVYLEACSRVGADPVSCVGLEDSPTGLAALLAAGLFAVGVPSFPGVVLEGADVRATSLLDPLVREVLGLTV